jgi:hypothetical protein
MDQNSRLVVRFACETTEISTTFIEDEFFGRLRALQFKDEARKAFHRVEMLGTVRDIWRNEKTYALTGGVNEDTDRRFVAFEGYAVVNLGEQVADEGAGGGSARTSRSRRAGRR